MILSLLVLAVVFAAGFGVGRIKNKSKLAEVAEYISAAEAEGLKDYSALVAAVKSKL